MKHAGIEMPVHGIAFDVAGTLIYPDPPAGEVYAAVGRRHGSQLSLREITQRFHQRFAAEDAADRAHRPKTSEQRELERWQAIVQDVLDDVADPEACFRELYAHFSQVDAWKLYPDAAEAVSQLLDAGRTVAVASNFDHRLYEICRGLPPLDRCAPVVISAAVGYRKPHPEFFARAAKLIGHPPERILHIGDCFDNDFVGARSAGWQSLLVARGHQRQGEGTVHDLREVLALLGL